MQPLEPPGDKPTRHQQTGGGVRVRPMQPADIEPVRWLTYRAYAAVLLELYGAEAAAQYEVRSRRFMAMYLARDPRASLVAEAADGTVVGSVFCFAWGEVGWFGSLAVAPEMQGQGIGQALTQQAIAYLAGQGCRRLGLETWPNAPLVHHLYGKFGFIPCRSTVRLSRAVRPPDPPGPPTGSEASGPEAAVEWVAAGRPEALNAALQRVQAVTARLAQAAGSEPLPDFQEEVRVAVEAGWAELCTLAGSNGEPGAFALSYTKRPSGDPVPALDVRLLVVAPPDAHEPAHADEARLDRVLQALETRAAALSLRSLTCDVNLRYQRAAALLRARGFRPFYELLRMERPTPGFDPLSRSPLIECARWAG